MKFSDSFLDEIRARLPVSQIVSRRVPLKRRGREFVGLSPFNREKTPSFTVNDQKGFYHCFSSGKHGDVFTFLMEIEGLSFPEAVERLAGEAGLETLKQVRIGFAPNSKDALKSALLKKGFTEAQLLDAGLLIKPDDGRATYDRFRNRLTI